MTAPHPATGAPHAGAPSTDRLGELLLSQGLVTREQLAAALQDQRSSHQRLGFILVRQGVLDELELTKVLARHYRMPAVDLSRFEVDTRMLRLIPADLAVKRMVLPLKREGRTLTVAVADPADQGLLEDLKFITRFDLFPVLAGEQTLRSLIERHYETGDEQLQSILKEMEGIGDDVEVVKEEDDAESMLQSQVDDAPVVKLINGILTDAVKRGASDVHIEPFEHEIRIRYRVDGALQEVMKPPLKMKAALTSRVKILAQLNIAERRVPQDGRLKLKMGTRVIDFRVSTLPVLFGEKIVLRILDKGNLTLDLTRFGFEVKAEADLMRAILNPYGMVLVTGPTGSGKTTTLYSALQRINTVETNIMTAEDPVEYNLPGINQAPVRPEVGTDLRGGPAGVPAAGPERDHDRRDPRPRDRRHRHQGGTDRPPGALDAAHQRRAEHGDPPDRHGDRGVQRRQCGQPGGGAAAGAPDLRQLQGVGDAHRCRVAGAVGEHRAAAADCLLPRHRL